jgi:hypothetical protein
MMVGLPGRMFSIRSRTGHAMPGRLRGRTILGLCLGLLAAAEIWTDAAGAEPVRPRDAEISVNFDIQDQPLSTAIERFSVLSGWQVIYDSALATGRRSARLKGSLPPPAALRILLAGTGLKADFMASDGAVLTLGQQLAIPSSERPAPQLQLRSYYGEIQATLKRAFCSDPRLSAGAFRIALGIWIDSAGQVIRAEALGTTGAREIDIAFESNVSDVAFQAPPVDFDQPVVVVVTPELLSQCGGGPLESVRQ